MVQGQLSILPKGVQNDHSPKVMLLIVFENMDGQVFLLQPIRILEGHGQSVQSFHFAISLQLLIETGIDDDQPVSLPDGLQQIIQTPLKLSTGEIRRTLIAHVADLDFVGNLTFQAAADGPFGKRLHGGSDDENEGGGHMIADEYVLSQIDDSGHKINPQFQLHRPLISLSIK